jgi:Protein of unknown function (DUF2971)
MHYFRYRSFSEISLKELLYSEIYFSSPEECNDPFDSKTFYVFNNDKEKWLKTILFACKSFGIPLRSELLEQLTEFICNQCPLTFDEATSKNLLNGFTSLSDENTLINYLSKSIQEVLKLYRPATRYFVSFSKTNSEPLMWSHYADKHNGYCLIFKAINGELNLSPNHKKDQIRRQTPNGLAIDMSYSLPKSFKFINIDYKTEVEELNAFLHMPVYVSGDTEDEEENIKIRIEQESHYSQKGQSWFYENESRLILPPPPSYLFGEHVEYTKQERLFHYEPSQLVGIIYGARMTDDDRNRVREILKERKKWADRTNDYKRTVFNFIEFQAKLSVNQRSVEIDPISIISYKSIPTTDTDFERLYAEWKEGIGHERENNSSKRVKIS